MWRKVRHLWAPGTNWKFTIDSHRKFTGEGQTFTPVTTITRSLLRIHETKITFHAVNIIRPSHLDSPYILRHTEAYHVSIWRRVVFPESANEILFPIKFASVYLEFAESTDGHLAVSPDIRVVLTGGPDPTFAVLPSVFVENFQAVRFRAIHQIAKFETVEQRLWHPWLPRAGHHGYRSFFLGISSEGKVIPWNVGSHDYHRDHHHHQRRQIIAIITITNDNDILFDGAFLLKSHWLPFRAIMTDPMAGIELFEWVQFDDFSTDVKLGQRPTPQHLLCNLCLTVAVPTSGGLDPSGDVRGQV